MLRDGCGVILCPPGPTTEYLENERWSIHESSSHSQITQGGAGVQNLQRDAQHMHVCESSFPPALHAFMAWESRPSDDLAGLASPRPIQSPRYLFAVICARTQAFATFGRFGDPIS